MNYRQIIAEAWINTQKDKKLILWFGFVPAIFSTIVTVYYLFYQFFAIKTSWIFDPENKGILFDLIRFLIDYFSNHLSFTPVIIVLLVIFGLIYYLFPTLAKGASIHIISQRRNGFETSLGTGTVQGIKSFLPLFKYHILIGTFSLFSIFIEVSFVLRNLGLGIFNMMIPVFILIIFISILLTVFLTFADFYIVLDKLPIVKSMKKSAILVLDNLKSTFIIALLMTVIGIRIVIQAFFILLIPALFVFVSAYITTIALPATALILGGIVGGLVLLLTAYLTGIVEIFSYSVWTYAFMYLKDMQKKEED